MKDTIQSVEEKDREWIRNLFLENKDILGPFDLAWIRFWQNNNPREKWIKINKEAFAHYLIKKNGEKTLYEIAVKNKGKGTGRKILNYIGFPMELKTDKNNKESNKFYISCGFICLGCKKSKNKKKEFNIYKRWY